MSRPSTVKWINGQMISNQLTYKGIYISWSSSDILDTKPTDSPLQVQLLTKQSFISPQFKIGLSIVLC